MKSLFTLALLTLITLTSCSKEETSDIIECYEIVELKYVTINIEGLQRVDLVSAKFSNGVVETRKFESIKGAYNGLEIGDESCAYASQWESWKGNDN